VPGYYDPALGRELARLGYYQSGFHTSLVCDPDLALPPAPGGVTVERVESPAALEEFLDAYIAGRVIPQGAQFKANVRPWLGEPGWQLYLARAEGRPAAAAILYVARQGRLLRRRPPPNPAFRGRGPADGAAARAASPTPGPPASIRLQRRGVPVPESTATWSASACACSSCVRLWTAL
jgi:hypothetical protein